MISYVDDIRDPRIAPYRGVADRVMRSDGMVVVESPKVIMTAMECGLRPLSILCEERHLTGDAAPILAACGDIEVFTGTREMLSALTGYVMTRGVLSVMMRPDRPDVSDMLANARRVVVLDDVCDATNVGAIIRTSAALGVDAMLMSSTTCDPLNRRSIRVSMGSVFRIPWTVTADPVGVLHDAGFKVAAMALRDDSITPDSPELCDTKRLAIVLGGEGYGLSNETIVRCDSTVCIPMRAGVDSLNVGAAAAIAIWAISDRK